MYRRAKTLLAGFTPVPPVSLLQMSGGCELVVVLLDFTSGGAGELSVRCGQTVELVERCAERPGWCLARTTDQTPQQVALQHLRKQRKVLQKQNICFHLKT